MKTKIIQSIDDEYKSELLTLYHDHDAWWAHNRTSKDVNVILLNSSFHSSEDAIDSRKFNLG